MTPAARAAERGQSTVLLIAVVTVLVAIGAALVGLGVEGAARGRVQAVADLTALAAAHGSTQGNEVARRNGAVVVSLDEADGTVTVVVERNGRRAVAAAES